MQKYAGIVNDHGALRAEFGPKIRQRFASTAMTTLLCTEEKLQERLDNFRQGSSGLKGDALATLLEQEQRALDELRCANAGIAAGKVTADDFPPPEESLDMSAFQREFMENADFRRAMVKKAGLETGSPVDPDNAALLETYLNEARAVSEKPLPLKLFSVAPPPKIWVQ